MADDRQAGVLREALHAHPDVCDGLSHPSWRPTDGYKCERVARAALAVAQVPALGPSVERGGLHTNDVKRARPAQEERLDEPKDYAQMWTDGGGDPTFDEIDGFLYRHFNARARYIE